MTIKVLILGAGAVGGWFGGKLVEYQQQQKQQQQKNGDDTTTNRPDVVDVTFLVRSGRATQLKSDGLILNDVYSGTTSTIRNVTCLISGTATAINSSGSTIATAGADVCSTNGRNDGSSYDHQQSTTTTTRFDIIILACKSYGLEGALDAIAPYVYPGIAIMPLLNGMAHLKTITERFPQATVWGGTCGIVASLDAEAGVISKHTASAWVKFGLQQSIITSDNVAPTDIGTTTITTTTSLEKHLSLMDTLASTWELSGLSEVEHIKGGKIIQAMWNKWVFLASLGASCCLWQGTTGDIVGTDYGEELIVAMIDECEQVADAELRSFVDDSSNDNDNDNDSNTITYQMIKKNFLHSNSPFKTSMARDMDQGFPTEADHLIGDLIRRARQHGVKTPLLCASYARLQIYESKRSSSVASS
jgi:2-dehydropantoate 2-reductase